MSAVKVFFVEKPHVVAAEYLRADAAAYPVVEVVADDGGGREDYHEDGEIERSDACQRSRREEERVARQKRRDDKPGLAEVDDEEYKI